MGRARISGVFLETTTTAIRSSPCPLQVYLDMEGVTLIESGTGRAHFAFLKRYEAAKSSGVSDITTDPGAPI